MILTLKQRIIFFICLAVAGFAISGLLGAFIIGHMENATAAMRIASVMQSIFMLILPALVAAMVITRLPADFLAINRKPDGVTLLLALAALLVAVPAMNWIIALNESITFPESLKSLEQALRSMEENADYTISLLQGDGSIGSLIMSILIVGVLAGFGEELFFRGTFQRLLTTGGVNRHVAVWLVAVVFSAIHFEFFGFIPRLLLGAYFGYLLAWSRCLWIPIALHAANNIIYTTSDWYARRYDELPNFVDTIGNDGSLPVILASVVATGVCLYLIWQRRVKN